MGLKGKNWTILTSRERLWFNFSKEVTFSQHIKTWQENNKLAMGPFKTISLALWHFPFHSNPPRSHFVNFTLSLSQCYSVKITSYGMREKKTFCMDASANHFISNEVQNRIFGHNHIFKHTGINNPCWQSSGIIIFLWICVRDVTFLVSSPPSHVIFCRLFHLLPPSGMLQFYVEKDNIFASENEWRRWGVTVCCYNLYRTP